MNLSNLEEQKIAVQNDVQRALAELEYAVKHLGLRIANLPAAWNGHYLGDPYFDLDVTRLRFLGGGWLQVRRQWRRRWLRTRWSRRWPGNLSRG
jgi:hypothetical protein